MRSSCFPLLQLLFFSWVVFATSVFSALVSEVHATEASSTFRTVVSYFRLLDSEQTYVPENILKILHNSVRVQGGNEFKFPVNVTALDDEQFKSAKDFFGSEEGKYYVGALSGGIIMLVWLFVWIILLLTSCLCRRFWPCCNDACIAVLLVFSVAVSTIGWFYSIGGNAELQKGLTRTVDDADLIEGQLNIALGGIDDILNATETVFNQINVSVSSGGPCNAFFTSTPGAQPTVNDFLTTANFVAVAQQPKDVLADARDVVSKSIDSVTPVLEKIGPVYTAFTATIISLLALFALTTTFKVLAEKNMLNCEENLIASINGCLNKFGVFLLFTLGFVVVLTIWILSAVMSPIATVGSDLCIPDFSSNLLSSVSDLLVATQGIDPNTDFCTFNVTSDSSDELKLANLICNYANCEGTNFILSDLGLDSQTGAASPITSAKASLQQVISAANGASQTSCATDLGNIDATLDTAQLGFDKVLGAINCTGVTPVYRKLVDFELCNGVVSGIGLIYVTWTTGAAGMMVAMLLFMLLDPTYVYNTPPPRTKTFMIIKDKQGGYNTVASSTYSDSGRHILPTADVLSSTQYNDDMQSVRTTETKYTSAIQPDVKKDPEYLYHPNEDVKVNF